MEVAFQTGDGKTSGGRDFEAKPFLFNRNHLKSLEITSSQKNIYKTQRQQKKNHQGGSTAAWCCGDAAGSAAFVRAFTGVTGDSKLKGCNMRSTWIPMKISNNPWNWCVKCGHIYVIYIYMCVCIYIWCFAERVVFSSQMGFHIYFEKDCMW